MWQYDTIEIVGNQMCVMDVDGNTLDAVPLTTYRAAKSQVQRWLWIHTILVAESYRLLQDYFERKKQG